MREVIYNSTFTKKSQEDESGRVTYSAKFVPFGVQSLDAYEYQSDAFESYFNSDPAPLPVYNAHDETSRVGRVLMDSIEIKKDGIYGSFELYNTPAAQNIMPAIVDGTLKSVSISAFVARDMINDDGELVLLEGELRELSIVQYPAFPDAVLTSGQKKDLERVLRSAGYSKNQALSIISNNTIKEYRDSKEVIKRLSDLDVNKNEDVSDSVVFNSEEDMLNIVTKAMHQILKENNDGRQ